MSKRFFKLTAMITPLHVLATLASDYLALGTLLDGMFGRLTYLQRLYIFLSDLFALPFTALLDRLGIDWGSSPWELLFVVLNSMIWGAAIAAMISLIPGTPIDSAAKS